MGDVRSFSLSFSILACRGMSGLYQNMSLRKCKYIKGVPSESSNFDGETLRAHHPGSRSNCLLLHRCGRIADSVTLIQILLKKRQKAA